MLNEEVLKLIVRWQMPPHTLEIHLGNLLRCGLKGKSQNALVNEIRHRSGTERQIVFERQLANVQYLIVIEVQNRFHIDMLALLFIDSRITLWR